MQIQKKIEDIKFTPMTVFGEEMEVSEDIVMASGNGWYVGAICKEGGFIQPYDRYTDYYATAEGAVQKCWRQCNGKF